MATIADTEEWKALEAHKKDISALHLRDLMGDAERSKALQTQADGFFLDYSRQNATGATKELLLALARAADLEGKKASMFAGSKINTTENRAAFHCALRAPKGTVMEIDGVDQVAEVHKVLDAIESFSARVRSGEWLGCTGKPLTQVALLQHVTLNYPS